MKWKQETWSDLTIIIQREGVSWLAIDIRITARTQDIESAVSTNAVSNSAVSVNIVVSMSMHQGRPQDLAGGGAKNFFF